VRGVAGQRGFTLVEVLVTMSLLLVVLGATLALFETFTRNERVNRLQADSQDQARNGTERLSRQLRNLASPLDNSPKAVEVAEDYDLVFKTVDPLKPNGSLNDRNIKRVRYCLSQETNGTATLWSQQQTWTAPNPPPPPGSRANCPDSSWGNETAVAGDLVNRAAGAPVFAYTPVGFASPDEIRAVRTDLRVDVNPGKLPRAVTLGSAVFLRNQNRAPVARCTATYAGNNQVVLNASGSEDPEGRDIRSYVWQRDGADLTPRLEGVVARWTATQPGTYTFGVTVTDAGGLPATSSCDQPVVVP
jgi:prepilin-type N-terminal cleavage/methylation domain-containing protein